MDIQKRIENYWSHRAAGYSQKTQSELGSYKEQIWLDLIHEHTSQHKLSVLDIGTGPGFFPIIMAKAGHQATGIDCTLEMLEQARINAVQHGVHVEFLKMDCHHLDFSDNSFDLLICRNLTWTLENPQAAYREWLRVLRPDGRLLIFDANWYLRLFDDRLKIAYDQDIKKIQTDNIPNPHTGVDIQESENIGSELPLSRIQRPEWDLDTLKSCGFKQASARKDISAIVWDNAEQTAFRCTPMFMVIASK